MNAFLYVCGAVFGVVLAIRIIVAVVRFYGDVIGGAVEYTLSPLEKATRKAGQRQRRRAAQPQKGRTGMGTNSASGIPLPTAKGLAHQERAIAPPEDQQPER